ncbi:MAG TPA: hypothetical protein VH062_02560 [Polyangiaceae bacterium]|jgi:hypothetical protein|nr:hypothetical protein [Polyangiaceae bacterium]
MIDAELSFPSLPGEAVGEPEDSGALRYDDVIQDGRLRLESAWRPTGKLLWRDPDAARVFGSMKGGVTNVLSRVTLQASDARLEPRASLRTRVSYRFEHTVNDAGAVDRILFSTWVEVHGKGRDGGYVPAARAYGQRVFTQLGAPPGKHLVTNLDAFGEAGHPPDRVTWEPVTALLTPPPGAALLDRAPRLDSVPVLFGLTHTDLNQHVNFLMYHRAIEQAALSRSKELGHGARLASREVSLGYRKPSFAGDEVRVAVQAFRLGGGFGVLAAVVTDDGGPAERERFADFGSPRVVAQMLLRS